MTAEQLAATRRAQARYTASRKEALIRQVENDVRSTALAWARTVEAIAATTPSDAAYMRLVDREVMLMRELRAAQARLKRLDPSTNLA